MYSLSIGENTHFVTLYKFLEFGIHFLVLQSRFGSSCTAILRDEESRDNGWKFMGMWSGFAANGSILLFSRGGEGGMGSLMALAAYLTPLSRF